jgi:hypothetical protein
VGRSLVTAEPANAAELHAAAVECAEAAVAMYEAQEAASAAAEDFQDEVARPYDHDSFMAAVNRSRGANTAYSAANFRHRNAVHAYVTIRPKGTP